MADNKENLVFDCSPNDYEVILFWVYRRLFSRLLEKSLDFYKWFHTEREPTRIYDSRDVAYVLNQLESDKPTDIDSLAERISGFYIDDAIVVMDAIRLRMNHLHDKTDTTQIARNDSVAIVLDCVRRFYDRV